MAFLKSILRRKKKEEPEELEVIRKEHLFSDDDEPEEEEEVYTTYAEDVKITKKLRDIQKEKTKKERFIRTRMWFSTLISKFYPDRVRIPPNIGNNIFIGNNQIVTKNSISSMVAIKELSDETPIALISKVIREVKDSIPGVYVDFVIKSIPYYPDMQASGLESRVQSWIRTIDNPLVSQRVKKRAARLLYSVDVAKSREKLYRSRIYFTVRGTNGLTLRNAIRLLESKLSEYKIEHQYIKSKVNDHLGYTSMLSVNSAEKVKNIPYVVTSGTIISELLPTIQGLNDSNGNYLGLNLNNKSPYYINFRGTAKGKNIYVAGLSGTGKTFLVISWSIDALAIGYRVCMVDIKGNEFIDFTLSVGGVVISLRQESRIFINTLRMRKEAVRGKDYTLYFNRNFGYTKMMLMFAASPAQETKGQVETIIDEFLEHLYMIKGVLKDNPNTWYRTESMHPLQLYKQFESYLSQNIIKQYPKTAERMLDRFKSYFHPTGSNSHMFTDEVAMDEVFKARVLTFDFGMLSSESVMDEASLNIKTMFMEIMNDAYVMNNKENGEWTFKVLEESQIVTDYTLSIYKKEITLRRAQQQVTVMLGNSVTALFNNKEADALLDNFNIIVVGQLNKRSREILIDEFGLENYRSVIMALSENPEYQNKFLLVNKMQAKATSALIRAYVPPHVAKSKLFTVVETEDEK